MRPALRVILVALVFMGCGRVEFELDAVDAELATTDAAALVLEPYECVEGDRRVLDPSGRCYTYYDGPMTWFEGLAMCEALPSGGRMAEIGSSDEQALVLELLMDLHDVWIGASDRETEMTWVWTSGDPARGSSAAFDNWRDGEPNEGGCCGEDCMVFEADTARGTWDDRPCDLTDRRDTTAPRYGVVCEREPSP